MSNKMHRDALLDGFAPCFPEGIEKLQDRYNEGSGTRNGAILLGAAKKVSGYLEAAIPTTSDGYTWFWAYTFVSWGRKRVTIAFPWRTDSAKRDGTKSDRHIALYMVNCSLYDATKLVDDFTAAMS